MDGTNARNAALMEHALEKLSRQPKGLSPKWFYDARGSELFEAITRLPEYYLGRTERAILAAGLAEIAAFVPDGAVLVELGSGASVKTRLLLDGLPHLSGYVPVDISRDFLSQTAAQLAADYPDLPITPVVADFMAEIVVPERDGRPIVGFFPGSTLGNLDPEGAVALLARLRAWPNHAALILGVDLVKAPARLEAAYDDAQGVTAAFNLNLLARLNREAGADFDLAAFRHRARWNASASRVEMHLESLRAQEVRIAERTIAFAAGETIHTENSHKFTAESLAAMAAAAGWDLAGVLSDPEALFAVALLRPSPSLGV
ncbi:MAG: L-histidine N(alpha)-methyltransferase [Alphaproteobacteria bacterium]